MFHLGRCPLALSTPDMDTKTEINGWLCGASMCRSCADKLCLPWNVHLDTRPWSWTPKGARQQLAMRASIRARQLLHQAQFSAFARLLGSISCNTAKGDYGRGLQSISESLCLARLCTRLCTLLWVYVCSNMKDWPCRPSHGAHSRKRVSHAYASDNVLLCACGRDQPGGVAKLDLPL